jgi:hypothetical protein
MNDTATIRSIVDRSDVGTYVNQLDRMIVAARKNILDARIMFATKRANLLAQLDDLDADARRRVPELQRMLDRLTAMRDSDG